jgi:hypothetical protein
MNCPLCFSDKTSFYIRAENREYWSCKSCELIFVSKKHLLPKEEELKRYDLHENHIEDIKYRQFLYRAIQPILERVPLGKKGLDYGSGPSPVLATLFEIEGYKMDFYDPYYAHNIEIYNKTYDFISLTEVAEHFYKSGQEFKQLFSLLKKGGYLIVMTHRTDNVSDFANWYYQKDATHVVFYNKKSFILLAEDQGVTLEFIDDRIVLFKK